jgi:hypothetical protein
MFNSDKTMEAWGFNALHLPHSHRAVGRIRRRAPGRALHEKAFRRLGGAVRVGILDSLREAVLVPDIYDPAWSPCLVAFKLAN